MSSFDLEPDQPIEELLSAIREGAREGTQSQSRTSSSQAGPLSALLLRLGRDAERTAGTIRRLTWAIVALTVVLLVLTGVLVWLTWILVDEEYSPEDGDEPASRTTAFYGQALPGEAKFRSLPRADWNIDLAAMPALDPTSRPSPG
jgi:hypothetical protein